MIEWKVCRLDEICDVRDGTHDSPKQSSSGYPLVTSKNIKSGQIDMKNVYLISESDFNHINKRSNVNKYDILYSMIGTVGEIAIVKTEPSFSIKNVGLFKCNSNYDLARWIYYYMKSPAALEELVAAQKGSTQSYISLTDLRSFPVLLPPLPEQKAIAAVLSSLDDKIDLLHRQNKTLEAMAETLFRQWFVEEADEGWEEGKVLDYCTHYKVGVKPQEFVSNSYSHYSIPAFDNGMNPIVENGSEIQSNKYIVVPNCLLFSKLNPNKDKRIWLILDQLGENPICSTEFQVVLPKSKKYIFFIYSWLSTPRNYNKIASGVGGTSGSHQRIDPADIFNFPCPRVSDGNIKSFNVMAEPIFMKMNNNHMQIRTLEKLRDTLLPKLMSGEVRVQV